MLELSLIRFLTIRNDDHGKLGGVSVSGKLCCKLIVASTRFGTLITLYNSSDVRLEFQISFFFQISNK